MKNLNCMMVLNHDPRPEGSQLKKIKGRGESAEICCNLCTCFLILYN